MLRLEEFQGAIMRMKFVGMAAIAALVASLTPAKADVIYSYTGNPFNVFAGVSCPSTCDITASFTVAQALPDDLSYDALVTNITPIAFSITDGVNTFTQLSNLSQTLISIGTDGSGTINKWDFYLIASGSPGGSLATYAPNQDNIFQDYSQFTSSAYAYNRNDPGTWSVSAVPELSTWAMMLIGFAGVGFVTYYRAKKNKATLITA
jgi:hypothetical protein